MEEYFQIALGIDKGRRDYGRIEKFISMIVDMAAEYVDEREKIKSVLLCKATSGYAEFVKALQSFHIHVVDFFDSGLTALHYAAGCDDTESIRNLLNCGTNTAARSQYGQAPLHYAARTGGAAAIKVLVEEGKAYVHVVDGRRRTALHYAAEGDHPESIRTLLSYGSDTAVRDLHGQTPLHYAASAEGAAAIKVLVEEGKADVQAVDESGETALHYAARFGNTESIRTLLEYGSDPAARNQDGRTPLHYAARGRESAAVKVLVEEGKADVHVVDGSGRTALHYAAEGNHPESIRTLLSYGSDTAARDQHGRTPLHYAVRTGGAAAIKVLVEEGKADDPVTFLPCTQTATCFDFDL
jgi:ankyrin repeat protein